MLSVEIALMMIIQNSLCLVQKKRSILFTFYYHFDVQMLFEIYVNILKLMIDLFNKRKEKIIFIYFIRFSYLYFPFFSYFNISRTKINIHHFYLISKIHLLHKSKY